MYFPFSKMSRNEINRACTVDIFSKIIFKRHFYEILRLVMYKVIMLKNTFVGLVGDGLLTNKIKA